MKKFFLFIPVLSILICLMYVNAGLNSWTQLVQSVTVFNDCIAINPTNPDIIYAGSNGTGVYQTTNGGVNWAQVNGGLTDVAVQVLTISNSSPTTLYAGGITGGMFKTTNSGTLWTQINTGITEVGKNVQAISVKTNDPNTAVIALFDGVNNATTGVYKTTNGGTSWAASITGILSLNKNFLSMATSPSQPNTLYLGGTFAASVGGVHVYKSYDFGTTWIDISNGIDTTLATGTDPFRDLSISTIDTNTVLAGRFFNTTNGGPWLTTNGGANWTQKPGGIPVATGLLVRSCKIRPGSNTEFFLGINGSTTTSPFGGVWRTTNAGTNWFSFNSTPMDSGKTVRSLNFRTSDNTLYAGVSAPAGTTTGVYAYSFPVPPAPLCEGFNSITFPPSGWTNTNTTLIYRSTASGFQLGSGSAYFDFWNVVSGTGDLTTITFIPSVANDSVQFTLAHCPFGSPDDILLQGSTNGGTTFTTIFDMTSVWMQTTTGCTRPFIPSAAGQWQRRGFPVPVGTNKIRFHATTGFGDGAYIDSVCVTHIIVGVNTNNNGVPKVYSLSQNYPNPFNPTTLINYTLPKAGNVELKVYDLLGREVATLVNEFKHAGYFSIEFNAANLASGVYFYKIKAGDFASVKKMLLIK